MVAALVCGNCHPNLPPTRRMVGVGLGSDSRITGTFEAMTAPSVGVDERARCLGRHRSMAYCDLGRDGGQNTHGVGRQGS